MPTDVRDIAAFLGLALSGLRGNNQNFPALLQLVQQAKEKRQRQSTLTSALEAGARARGLEEQGQFGDAAEELARLIPNLDAYGMESASRLFGERAKLLRERHEQSKVAGSLLQAGDLTPDRLRELAKQDPAGPIARLVSERLLAKPDIRETGGQFFRVAPFGEKVEALPGSPSPSGLQWKMSDLSPQTKAALAQNKLNATQVLSWANDPDHPNQAAALEAIGKAGETDEKNILSLVGISSTEARILDSMALPGRSAREVAQSLLSGSPQEKLQAQLVRRRAQADIERQREAMRIIVPPPETAVHRTVAMRTVLDSVKTLERLSRKRPDLVGFFPGAVTEIEQLFGGRDPDANELVTALRQLRDEELVLRAGLAQTASEAGRAIGLLKARLPITQQPIDVFRSRLAATRKRAELALTTYREAYQKSSLGPLLQQLGGPEPGLGPGIEELD